MHISNLALIIALEIYLALLLATLGLLYFAFKQKKLINRQQEKLKELLELMNIRPGSSDQTEKSYGQHIDEQLALTSDHFNMLGSLTSIETLTAFDAPLSHRITALRHAFLSAEALAAEIPAKNALYWATLEQGLLPLLQQPDQQQENTDDELEIYKKRVENLEQFKKLFFDLEDRWNQAQANAQNYYNELHAMASDVSDPAKYLTLLGQFTQNYDDIQHRLLAARSMISGTASENKTINIIRQDPRAAEEIIKLRNVAADQYRTIGDLQRKLDKALSSEEKDSIIKELDQQLQRQVRFVQESDTCIQLLEEELHKANEKLASQEHKITADHELEKENQRIRETLHNFAHESKELLVNIESLEKENEYLKQNHDGQVHGTDEAKEVKELDTELIKLRKQYAELEEKYLALKTKQ